MNATDRLIKMIARKPQSERDKFIDCMSKWEMAMIAAKLKLDVKSIPVADLSQKVKEHFNKQ